VISWRYHIVSIVAVVLAFGLGILAGSSVVGEGLVNQLRQGTEEARRERDEARAAVDLYTTALTELESTLRDGVLTTEDVVVVSVDGVDGTVSRTLDELAAAGAEVLATLELSRRLAEPEIEENRAAIEEVLGVTGSDPGALADSTAAALAGRLAEGQLDPEDDLLGQLLAAGLVSADRDLDPETLQVIGGAGQTVVIVAGGTPPEGYPAPEVLLVPLTERLVRLDVPTAAVGPRVDDYGYVAAVREASGILDCSMVTVDDIDVDPLGGITLAMALDRYLAAPDAAFRPGGDYGLRGTALVPGADEPPESCRV
jgi:hypothetical protein